MDKQFPACWPEVRKWVEEQLRPFSFHIRLQCAHHVNKACELCLGINKLARRNKPSVKTDSWPRRWNKCKCVFSPPVGIDKSVHEEHTTLGNDLPSDKVLALTDAAKRNNFPPLKNVLRPTNACLWMSYSHSGRVPKNIPNKTEYWINVAFCGLRIGEHNLKYNPSGSIFVYLPIW